MINWTMIKLTDIVSITKHIALILEYDDIVLMGVELIITAICNIL